MQIQAFVMDPVLVVGVTQGDEILGFIRSTPRPENNVVHLQPPSSGATWSLAAPLIAFKNSPLRGPA